MKTYFQTLHTTMVNLEKPFASLMQKGFLFSFALCLFAAFLFIGYLTSLAEPIIYYAGFSLFQSGIFFAALFYVFAIAFDGMAKRIV